MNEGGFTPDFYDWLTHHTNVIKYLQIDHCYGQDHNTNQKDIILTASKLINFYNLNLLTLKPHDPQTLALPPSDYGSKASDLTRRINFLRKKAYKIQLKHYNNVMQMCSDFINLYNTPNLIPDSLTIHLKESLFFHDALTEPPKKARLLNKANTLENALANCIKLLQLSKMPENFSNILFKILKDTSLIYIKDLHYFPLTRYQSRFDQWLFSLGNPLVSSVQIFFQTFSDIEKYEFTPSLMNLLTELISSINTQDSTKLSILSLYFFRSVFGAVYAVNSSYLIRKQRSVLPYLSKTLTCKDFKPPTLYVGCYNDSDLVSSVFQKIPEFQKVISGFSSLSFCTNPLDAIYEIHLVLNQVQKYISHVNTKFNKTDRLFEFESIFSLFFGILLSSDIPNFEEMAQFIIDFAPDGNLSPAFSYAHVTASAALTHIHEISEALHLNIGEVSE